MSIFSLKKVSVLLIFITFISIYFLKFDKNLIIENSVKELKTKRAESLGLNVNKVEKILKYKMPNLKQVCQNLNKEIKK